MAIQLVHSNSEASRRISTALCCLRAALHYMDTCFYTAQVSLQLLRDKTFLVQKMYNGKILSHTRWEITFHISCVTAVVLLVAAVQEQFCLIAKSQLDCQCGCPSNSSYVYGYIHYIS